MVIGTLICRHVVCMYVCKMTFLIYNPVVEMIALISVKCKVSLDADLITSSEFHCSFSPALLVATATVLVGYAYQVLCVYVMVLRKCVVKFTCDATWRYSPASLSTHVVPLGYSPSPCNFTHYSTSTLGRL